MKEILGLITVALSFIGYVPYIKDTLAGKTRPHVFSWFTWTILTVLAAVSSWAKGGGAGAWNNAFTSVICVVITVLAWKHGRKDISSSDKFFFVAALLAIIPWYLTKDPTLSVIIITIVDACAFYPTIRKTIQDPSSETFVSYVLNTLRHGLSIVALGSYNVATLLFPTYLVIANAFMVAIIARWKVKTK